MSGADNCAKVRIDLTPQKSDLVKAALGRDADVIELTVQELEQRIAPTDSGSLTGSGVFRLALNCNETLLVG